MSKSDFERLLDRSLALYKTYGSLVVARAKVQFYSPGSRDLDQAVDEAWTDYLTMYRKAFSVKPV